MNAWYWNDFLSGIKKLWRDGSLCDICPIKSSDIAYQLNVKCELFWFSLAVSASTCILIGCQLSKTGQSGWIITCIAIGNCGSNSLVKSQSLKQQHCCYNWTGDLANAEEKIQVRKSCLVKEMLSGIHWQRSGISQGKGTCRHKIDGRSVRVVEEMKNVTLLYKTLLPEYWLLCQHLYEVSISVRPDWLFLRSVPHFKSQPLWMHCYF